MSGLAGLDIKTINVITNQPGLRDVTITQLRNFLQGRVTTVADEGEFTMALKKIIQDLEGQTSLPEGQATGEILGALEGGGVVGLAGGAIIAFKGLEIAQELSELAFGNAAENLARNRLRDQLSDETARNITHGDMGRPSRNTQDLIDQQVEQERTQRGKARGEEPSDRKFSEADPLLPFRQSRETVTDVFPSSSSDVPETIINVEPEGIEDTPSKKAQAVAAAVGGLVGVGAIIEGLAGGKNIPPTIDLLPVDPNSAGRRPKVPPQANPADETTTSDHGSAKMGLLRAQFLQTGTDYIDSIFQTPQTVQNSEWTEFDFVTYDRQNLIQTSNLRNEAIRFKNPLFSPDYVPPLEAPSQQAVRLSYIPMRREIQLTQPFVNKFDGADMGRRSQFTSPVNRSAFDSGFERLKIYNPI